MAGVFVSYAREDAAKAKVIARELEQAGFDVWIDQRISSGSEYSREIEEALRNASAVVVLWSKHSVDSAWVRDEAAEGRDSGRLIPIAIDALRPPIGFRQFQATDMSRWSGRGRPKQIDEIIAAVAAKAGAPPQPRQPLRTDRQPLKRPMILVSVGLAAILIAVAVVALGVFLFLLPFVAVMALLVYLFPSRFRARSYRRKGGVTIIDGDFRVVNPTEPERQRLDQEP